MPWDNLIQEEDGSSNGAFPLVEAQPADEVEHVASVLRERQVKIPWAALLLHVGFGKTPRAVRWLDDLAEYWAASMREQQPWGRLSPLPQIVVEADDEAPECRAEFIRWGISSFADGRPVRQIAREMRQAVAAAEEAGAFEIPAGETSPGSDRGRWESAHPDLYNEALQALKDLGKNHEQED